MPAREVAFVLCDLWDDHWCRGAAERVNEMAPRINMVVRALREKGVLIVHAPSDTMDFYADTPARERVLRLFEQKHEAINIQLAFPSLDGIKRAVEMDLGVALLPRRCALAERCRF